MKNSVQITTITCRYSLTNARIVVQGKILALCASILVMMTACTSTSVTTQVDPNLGNKKFKNFHVEAAFAKTNLLKMFENYTAVELYENGANAYVNHEYLPNIRKYTSEEIWEFRRKYNINAYLFITPTTAYEDFLQKYNAYGATGPKQYNGMEINFDVELYDLNTGKVVWKADVKTGGTKYASMTDIADSFASNLVEKLIEDGLMVKIVREKK